jgi:hypothetical protein
MAYSYFDPKIMEKITLSEEYYKLQEKFREDWEKIPEGSHPLKPKITSKDYEYMLHIQTNSNYQLHFELCKDCADELESWVEEQYHKNKNR